MTNRITITEGLASLKLLDSRINKLTHSMKALLIGFANPNTPVVKSRQDNFETIAISNLASINDLIKRRQSIKSQIVASNAVTIVTIGGIEYTVAEAIEAKKSIEYKKELRDQLYRELSANQSKLQRDEEAYVTRLDQYINQQAAALGKTKNDAGWLEEATKAFARTNQPMLIDPLGIQELLAVLDNEIEAFESAVDIKLSISNSTTFITV